jgi:hypothetical protein
MRQSQMAWSDDFSYRYYRGILNALEGRFTARLFREAPKLATLSASVFLRHDIDISLPPALRMAAVEEEQGLRATYMVMVRSSLYDVGRADSRAILRQILSMGHEVGVHFDCPEELRQDQGRIDDLESSILEDCRRLEDVVGTAVNSISFHRPISWLLRGPLLISGKVNAYAAGLMEWYLSDSKGNWREGEPRRLLSEKGNSVLQLLTHPIWWGEEHQPAAERLELFYLSQTRDMEPGAARHFDRILSETIPGILRSGHSQEVRAWAS